MREGTFIASFGFYKLDKSFYTVKFRWQEVGVQAAATDESSIASHEMKRNFLEELADKFFLIRSTVYCQGSSKAFELGDCYSMDAS